MPGNRLSVTFNFGSPPNWTYHFLFLIVSRLLKVTTGRPVARLIVLGSYPGGVLVRHAGRYFATPKFFRNAS